jgi:ABC-2 type transport system ATP-binding protein
MITARSLTRTFGRHRALDGIDLTIAKGEMFALIGPDGAGKTTFFRIVAGLLKPTSGTLERAPGDFGLVPQRFSLYQDLSIDENLALRGSLYGVPARVARERAADLLSRVGLQRFGARLAGRLSGGMKQKLALSAALLIEPSLLLLDEPTTGVDPLSRREFWGTLHRLHHEGLTIVVSTPYMDEAAYATRLGFLHRGRLLATGTRTEILAGYSRALVEVRSLNRVGVRARLRTSAPSTTCRSSAPCCTCAAPMAWGPSWPTSCAMRSAASRRTTRSRASSPRSRTSSCSTATSPTPAGSVPHDTRRRT